MKVEKFTVLAMDSKGDKREQDKAQYVWHNERSLRPCFQHLLDKGSLTHSFAT